MKRSLFALVLAVALAPSARAMHAPAESAYSTSSPAIDAATRHHHPDVVQRPARIITVSAVDGFDWGDAGIGAAGTLGVVLVAGGSALLLRRNSRQKGAFLV